MNAIVWCWKGHNLAKGCSRKVRSCPLDHQMVIAGFPMKWEIVSTWFKKSQEKLTIGELVWFDYWIKHKNCNSGGPGASHHTRIERFWAPPWIHVQNRRVGRWRLHVRPSSKPPVVRSRRRGKHSFPKSHQGGIREGLKTLLFGKSLGLWETSDTKVTTWIP